jgi:hypothetical protein
MSKSLTTAGNFYASCPAGTPVTPGPKGKPSRKLLHGELSPALVETRGSGSQFPVSIDNWSLAEAKVSNRASNETTESETGNGQR